MDIKTRNRAEIKSYFVKNSTPTQSNFGEFIDGMLNQKDDGIVKSPGDPLSIEAAGDASSQKNAINFFSSFSDTKPTWSLSLNPRSKQNAPTTARAGFSINDSSGNSRLFIDGSSGAVGLGTIEPLTGRFEIASGWGNWLFLKQQRATEGGGGFLIHNPWKDTDKSDRNALILAYKTASGKIDWAKSVDINGPTGYVGIGSTPTERLDVNGRVKAGDLTIGPWPSSTSKDYVFFGSNRLAQTQSANYALLQHSSGRTYLNSPVDIRFRIKNVDQAFVHGKGITIRENAQLSFNNKTRQMINLWSTEYGIGIQGGTQYFRTGKNFCWFLKGTHHNSESNPGSGGKRLMALNSAGDLILSGRTNPTAVSTKSRCRALVDNANLLVINYAGDFSKGVRVDGDFTVNKGGSIVLHKTANTASSKQKLQGLQNSSLIIGGVWRGKIYFYFKDDQGKLFISTLTGTAL